MILLQGYVFALAACASGAASVNPRNATGTNPTIRTDPARSARADDAALQDHERAAYERALPAFQRHCARCHTTGGEKANKGGALKHFNMDRYPFTGHHASDIDETIRSVLGAVGERPSMPRDNPGAVSGEELALILAWADAFERARGVAGDRSGHNHAE